MRPTARYNISLSHHFVSFDIFVITYIGLLLRKIDTATGDRLYFCAILLVFFSVIYNISDFLVHYFSARPVPPWVQTIQVDPQIDTGITGSSDGFTILSHNMVQRHRTGGWETDGAKWGARK